MTRQMGSWQNLPKTHTEHSHETMTTKLEPNVFKKRKREICTVSSFYFTSHKVRIGLPVTFFMEGEGEGEEEEKGGGGGVCLSVCL